MLIPTVFAAAWLLAAHAADEASPPTDRIEVGQTSTGLDLRWHDAEDRLDGTVQPLNLRSDHPMDVSLRVGSFEGAPFDGPIQLTLRAPGEQNGETVTAKKGAVNWHATFTPKTEGPHSLDVVFRTTRVKVLHAELEVAPSLPFSPAQAGLIAVTLIGVGVIAFQVIRTLRRKDPPSPTPAG